jgi:ribosomal protein L11 methyltransferase
MNSWSLTLESTPADRDLLVADLWEAGTTGITEDESWLRAFFDESANQNEILRRFAAFHPRLEQQEEHDWVEHARSMWRAFPVGERFWLTPEWLEDTAPVGRLRLPMRPGMASGTGLHPATQLCLMALERTLRPGSAVLDVGTGSGILAEGARLLGAQRVIGCDIDHAATEVAHRNVPEVAFFTGSLRSVRPGTFDVAVANLNAATISMVVRDLRSVAITVIVGGFREEESPRVAQSLGRSVKENLELDGWACLIC